MRLSQGAKWGVMGNGTLSYMGLWAENRVPKGCVCKLRGQHRVLLSPSWILLIGRTIIQLYDIVYSRLLYSIVSLYFSLVYSQPHCSILPYI